MVDILSDRYCTTLVLYGVIPVQSLHLSRPVRSILEFFRWGWMFANYSNRLQSEEAR